MPHELRTRRSFLQVSSALTLGLGARSAGGAPARPTTDAGAAATGKLPYRMIYDEDAVDFLNRRIKEPITGGHVDRMVDEVVDAGADLFLQCACYHRTTYPSQVWESMWDEYRARGTSYGGQGWIEVARQGLRLEEQGVDFLGRALARARVRGVASGVTIRMDDLHYRGPDSIGRTTLRAELAKFYQDPDNYLPDTGRYAGRYAFNYARPAVRAHYLGLIRELIERYDFDVLSLDYVRHPPFFDRGQVERHGEIMTDFLREARRLCTAGGRRTAILARVPATPANCRELGLDVGAWARAGLVQGLALGMKNCTGWETPVDAFRAEVGPSVALYGATERQAGRTALAHVRDDSNRRSSASRWTREMFRGFAAGQLATGADGIYLFNFFLGNLAMFDVLPEMKSLATLRDKPKTYRVATYGTEHAAEVDLPTQVPVTVPAQHTRRFEILLATERAGTPAEVRVLLDRPVAPATLWLQFNDTPLGAPVALREETNEERCYAWADLLEGVVAAIFVLPPERIRDGRNHLVFRSEQSPVTVLGVAVRTGRPLAG